jgi:hypothetical protein
MRGDLFLLIAAVRWRVQRRRLPRNERGLVKKGWLKRQSIKLAGERASGNLTSEDVNKSVQPQMGSIPLNVTNRATLRAASRLNPSGLRRATKAAHSRRRANSLDQRTMAGIELPNPFNCLTLRMMRWGMPPPPRAGGFPVTNIRNTTSPHWRGWLKPESRCLVPANSFAEYAPEPNPATGKKDVVWFALNDDPAAVRFRRTLDRVQG